MGIFTTSKQEEPKQEYHGFFVEKNQEVDIKIDEDRAMEIPSFSNALETIVTAISRLDVKLYQEDVNGRVERHLNDHRLHLLNEENHFYGNAVDYKKQIVKDMLINGVSYSYLDKSGLDVNGIYRIDPKNTTLEKKFNAKGVPTSIKVEMALNDQKSTANLEDMIVIPFRSNDGLVGKSIFDRNQRILKLMYQELEYHEHVYKNASVPFGVLETPSKVSKDVIEKLKATWSNLYKGVKNSGKIAVLENGLTYKPISQNPNDILLLDSRKANAREMEKVFNLPNGILESTSNNSQVDIEMLQGYFKNKTIEPILKLIEEAFNKALLLEDEKEKGYYFKFDTKPLDMIKGKEFVDNIATKITSGLMTINEARAEFDMKDFENGDNLLLSLGNVLMTKEGETIVPNMGLSMNDTNTKEGTKTSLE